VTARHLAICLVTVLWLAACGPQRTTELDPKFDMQAMAREVKAIVEAAKPAEVTVAFMDPENAEVWSHYGDTPVPMQDLAVLPLAAAVLAEVDEGRLSLDEVLVIQETDLSPQPSAVATDWPDQDRYTIADLLAKAILHSDNTAADVLMKRIGGPGAVTAWLTARRVRGVRVDRYQREIQMEMAGLPSFRSAWKDETPFAEVPEPRRRAALTAFLADARDSATAHGLIDFLSRLEAGELVSPASRELLLDLMEEGQSGAGRIAAGLPRGARLAHRTGTARPDLGLVPVVSDAGVITTRRGRRFAIAVLMRGCRGAPADCERILARTTRAMIAAAG